MFLKENRKEILLLIFCTILMIFGMIHIQEIFSFFLYMIRICMPFIIGCMMAFVLNVFLHFVEEKLFKKWHPKKKRIKRTVSLLLTLFLLIGFLALVIGLVVPELKNTASIFTKNIPSYQKNIEEMLDKVHIDPDKIAEVSSYAEDIKESATSFMKNHSSQIVEGALGFASSLVSVFVNIGLGFVFAIYILSQKEKLRDQLQKIMKAYLGKAKREKIGKIASLSNQTFCNFVSGQVLEAFIIGALCFIGMLILRLPYAPTISVLVGFTALIPVFGAFIGTAVGAFLILMVNPMQALIFILFILVLQQLEGNFIYPKVVGKSVNLPSIWVMVAVTIGAATFGIAGMLISVPVCSVCYSVFAANVHEKIEKKNKTSKEKMKKA